MLTKIQIKLHAHLDFLCDGQQQNQIGLLRRIRIALGVRGIAVGRGVAADFENPIA
jgi:hypothetical protein